jgi:hypothetical protein
MPTLSELTLQLSRDLSTNHQDCIRQLDELERDRMSALESVADASAVLKAARKAAVDAAVVRDDALVQIDIEQQRAERKAAADRVAVLRATEQAFKEADRASLEVRQDAENEARAELKVELSKIDGDVKTNAAAKLLSRRDAEQRFEETVRAIHAAFLESLAANKNTQVDKFRAALTKEVLDSRIARDDAHAKRSQTEHLFQRALKAAETRLRAALAELPAAAAVQARFDSRRAEIKADCRRREEALFAEFREAKERLA